MSASRKLPLIPGLSPTAGIQKDGLIPRTFDFKNGYCVHKDGDVPVVTTDFEMLEPVHAKFEVESQAPDWLKYDKVVLRWHATTTDTITERQYQGALTEGERVRKVAILYYMDSGEIQVDEVKEHNSGIKGGPLVGRMIIRNYDNKPLTPTFFKVGEEVVLHNRVYRIHDADAHTRDFMLNHYQIRSPDPSPVAEDAWHLKQRTEVNEACTPKCEIVAFNEVANGGMDKETLVRSRQFNKYLGQVLRFWAHYRDTSEHGMDKEYIVHYFMADDTMEVRNHNMQDGECSFPLLLSRQKLPRVIPSLSVDRIGAKSEYVNHADLRVGGTLSVLGRELVLLRADKFTQEFYVREHGLSEADFTPVEIKAPEPPVKRQNRKILDYLDEYPPRPHAQEPADPKRRQKWGISCMRWQAKLAHASEMNDIRRFCISYYLADDSILIHENAGRNSGFDSGRFMQKTRLKNPVTGTYFQPQDFMVGCTVKINSWVFELLKADCNNQSIIGGQKRNSLVRLSKVLRDMSTQGHFKRFSTFKTFLNIDSNRDTMISKDEFGRWMKRFGYDLEGPKVTKIFDKFDKNHDGWIDLSEFMTTVEEEALLSPRQRLAFNKFVEEKSRPTTPNGRDRVAEE